MIGLVYHAGALGDFVAALPAIAAWRRQPHGAAASCGAALPRPAARIAAVPKARGSVAGGGPVVLLGRPAHAALAAGVVDDAWDAGSARFASLFAGRASPEVRGLLADIGSALVFAPAEAGIVRGLESAGVRDILRHDPFPKERVHVVDYHLSLFPDLALAPEERVPRIEVPAGSGPACPPSARPIVLHPGSGSPSKNWPLDRFIELAALLEDRGSIAWVIGPAEEESGTAAAIDGAIPAARAWRTLPLPELADRLAGARLFVGNDSGVAHLAAAVGCPVVVLFGASDPVVWAPRGRSVTVVGDGTSGMAAIGVRAVVQAAIAAS